MINDNLLIIANANIGSLIIIVTVVIIIIIIIIIYTLEYLVSS